MSSSTFSAKQLTHYFGGLTKFKHNLYVILYSPDNFRNSNLDQEARNLQIEQLVYAEHLCSRLRAQEQHQELDPEGTLNNYNIYFGDVLMPREDVSTLRQELDTFFNLYLS
jgi:hypothetical protein